MHFETKPLLRIFSGAVVLMVAGCGGGNGDGSADPPGAAEAPAAPVVHTLTGTAASGAPFTDAVVAVVDRRGALVGASEPIGADGRYRVQLSPDAQPPFVLIASRAGAPGETQSLVSVLESADSVVANVTPITHLIASRLSTNGDPLMLASDLAAGRAPLDAARVSAAVAEIRQILAPVLAATGTVEFDPLKSEFAADGTGHDRLLDSLRIEIVPADATSSNIEIGIRYTSDDDATPPPVIRFGSAQDVSAITSANRISGTAIGDTQIASDTLVVPGTSVRIAELLQALNACFALPTNTRVNLSGAGATATNIVASECRRVFADDDPAVFRNGGATVGGAANKPFRSMFFDSGTNLVFSQGSYEFMRADGHVVIGYRSRDADGNESFGTFVARPAADGRLALIGDQYDFPGEVVASQQLRRHITLGQEPFSYYSTGYTLNVPNLSVGGAPRFDRVEVTTPRGKVLTLRPRSGRSALVLQYGYLPNPTNDPNGLSNSGEIRLRSEYLEPMTPATPPPSAKETARLYFAAPAQYPDDASIESLSAHSLWTFRYYLASDPGALASTQVFRTRSRPMSIRELRQQGLPELDGPTVARLKAATNPPGTPSEGQALLPSDAPLEPFTWTAPERAVAPTSVALFGLLAGTSTPFDDGVRVGSAQRAAQIPCAGDDARQCNAAVAGAWAPDTYMNGVSLGSLDATGRSFSSYYSMNKLAP